MNDWAPWPDAGPSSEEVANSNRSPVVAEQEMSHREAEMYAMLRRLRCYQGQVVACPARIIIGQSGVVLECPTCGWVGQTYPDDRPE